MTSSNQLLATTAAALFLCCAVPSMASAQPELTHSEISVEPPSGFYLASTRSRPIRFYGPSNADVAANWSISQWGFPRDLPAFQGGTTQTQWAKVAVSGNMVSLTVNQGDTPCERDFPSGRRLTNEWGFFASPIGPNAQGISSAMGAVKPSLDQLQSIQLTVTETLTHQELLDSACEPSKVFIVTAITIVDPISKQTLFYGTGTFHILKHGQVTSAATASAGGHQNMYFRGFNTQSGDKNVFGYSESVAAAYGAPELRPGQTVTYNIDLLPHVISAIKLGKDDGMDQNLSHWQVRGYYEGTTTAGHVAAETHWSNFSLKLKYR